MNYSGRSGLPVRGWLRCERLGTAEFLPFNLSAVRHSNPKQVRHASGEKAFITLDWQLFIYLFVCLFIYLIIRLFA